MARILSSKGASQFQVQIGERISTHARARARGRRQVGKEGNEGRRKEEGGMAVVKFSGSMQMSVADWLLL